MAKKFEMSTMSNPVDIEKIKSSRSNAYVNDFISSERKTVKIIPLADIDAFPDHPFKVLDNEDMAELVESIKLNGVLTPITVIERANGRYVVISGHRRCRAAELAGLTEIPAIVEEMSEEQAVIAMVDANLQREKILPSEKAFAYKMKLAAMKRQGKRTDLTSSQVATKLQGRSDVALSEQVGESKDTIHRYIRLTRLIPQILEMTDNEKIPLTIAADISYLEVDMQCALLDHLNKGKKLTARQASELKQLQKAKILDADTLHKTLYPTLELKFEPPSDAKASENFEQLAIDEIPKSEKSNEVKKLVEKLKAKHCDYPGNWSDEENRVMKGYIIRAFNLWNEENPDDGIARDVLDKLLDALKISVDEMTASEAYRYYISH